MSFKLNWGPFDESFYDTIKKGLNKTLNSGPPIPNIVDQLLVHEFCLGDQPPALELLEIADASKEKFRFIFQVCYKGNGLLELRTRVQANPVFLGTSITPSRSERKLLRQLNMGPAMNPHIMPLSIVITDIVFDGQLSVAFINNNKIEAFFPTDPLKQVNIKTSFDEFPAAANFIKKLVEEQLRNFIMKDFPQIVGSITVPSPPSSPQQQSSNSVSINSFLGGSVGAGASNNSPLLNNNNHNHNNHIHNNHQNPINIPPSYQTSLLNNTSSSSRLDSSSSFFGTSDDHNHQQQPQKHKKKKQYQHSQNFNEKHQQKQHINNNNSSSIQPPSSTSFYLNNKEIQRMDLL